MKKLITAVSILSIGTIPLMADNSASESNSGANRRATDKTSQSQSSTDTSDTDISGSVGGSTGTGTSTGGTSASGRTGSSTGSSTDSSSETTRSGTSSTTTSSVSFNPEVRTKVVKFFDNDKAETWSGKIKMKSVPAGWRTTISPGMVIAEKERTLLVEAPPELVQVLPAPTAGIRYYVAGSNIVAVDSSYRVVDAINVPSIKVTTD